MAALILNLCTRRRSVTSCQLLLIYPCGTRHVILKRYMDPGVGVDTLENREASCLACRLITVPSSITGAKIFTYDW
jgi:hypothetical protein